MGRGPSPLLGYNTNIRHKGKIYHLQTEDSGVGHPHIITHLFADGGRVVASKKTNYSEYVGTENYQSVVKRLMQDQHKAMFIALRDGVYDEEDASASVSRRYGVSDTEKSSASSQRPEATAARPPGTHARGSKAPPETLEAHSGRPSVDKPSRRDVSQRPQPTRGRDSSTAPSSHRTHELSPPSKSSESQSFETAKTPIPKRPPKRASEEVKGRNQSTRVFSAPSACSGLDQPPALRRTSASGEAATRTIEDSRGAGVNPPAAQGNVAGRSAAARGNSGVENPTNPHDPSSIFGSRLRDEKSLDEVILSYLADDLGEPEA
ncbi:MAG: hypothetical protein AAF355_05700 [Myxococcota bacterium]